MLNLIKVESRLLLERERAKTFGREGRGDARGTIQWRLDLVVVEVKRIGAGGMDTTDDPSMVTSR